MEGMQVQSFVWEPRWHVPQGEAKRLKKKKKDSAQGFKVVSGRLEAFCFLYINHFAPQTLECVCL